MFDFAALESRLAHIEGDVVSDLEREAHTKIGTVLTEGARELIAVLPEGSAIDSAVSLFTQLADVAHTAVHAAAAAVDPEALADTAAPSGDAPSGSTEGA